MLISELPQPYKALAIQRTKENHGELYDENDPDLNYLSPSFMWAATEEGHGFWSKCDGAQTESELPPYPYE